MEMEAAGESSINLLAQLEKVTDPRRREGKVYPLASLLGMLILAALNGESSLRGMVGWGCAHWLQLVKPLHFKLGSSAPVYSTVWTVLSQLAPAELEGVLGAWTTAEVMTNTEAVDIDGKYLRGSKRRGSQLPALQVVTAAAQGIGVVLGQAEDAEVNSITAAVALLERLPLADKVVTTDAGLLHQEVTETILEKGGPIWGS
jgi:hypothetical protein